MSAWDGVRVGSCQEGLGRGGPWREWVRRYEVAPTIDIWALLPRMRDVGAESVTGDLSPLKLVTGRWLW